MLKNDSAHERLTQVVKQAPNREWMDQYLDLLKELIEFAELENDDPRLVLSLAQSGNFPVTINRRYVLSGFRKRKPLVGFIFPYDFEQLPALLTLAVPPEFSSHQYSPHSGEIAEQAPYFLEFEGLPKELLTIEQKVAWKRAILSEVKRCQGSSYKKFHESIVYKAAVNISYRSSLLNEAFPGQHQQVRSYKKLSRCQLNKVPSSAEYVAGLTKIKNRINEFQLQLLQEQYYAPSRSVTAPALARLVNTKNYSVVNSMYGKLGHLFCEATGLETGKNRDGTVRWWTVWSVGYATQEGFLWEMHLEVAEALERLGWVGTELNSASADSIFPDEVTEETFREGAVRQVSVNAYERDPKARQKCIEYYGLDCSVCGFNFSKVFGQIGEGFIHVHHLRPISEIGAEYEVDPIKDLRPVCPNCHAMIHRHSPPLSIEEIKMLFDDRSL